MPSTTDLNRRFAALPEYATRWAGSVPASLAATAVVASLLIVGMATRFPHWWQVTVHASGALVSLLMVFLIQHTTERQTKAILVKLDELVIATEGARDEVVEIEKHQTDEQQEIHEDLHHNRGRR